MKEDRNRNDEQRKRDFEPSAFQEQPNRGAWTGGWRDLPGQRTWLDSARRTQVEDAPKRTAPVERERPDAEILADLREALAGLDGRVHVEVLEGDVVLQGRVASPGARLEALRIVGSTAGVRELYDHLEVGAGPGGD